MTMRNTLDRYWKLAEVAPPGIALQVQVTNAASDLYVLPFPCKLTAAGWVNAVTGTALVVKPTYWKCMLRRSRASRRGCKGPAGRAGNDPPEATEIGRSTGELLRNIPLRGKNWSEHERAEIGRLEAVCSATDQWTWSAITRMRAILGASSTTSSITGSPAHRAHRAPIRRRWPREGRSAETLNMTAAVEMAWSGWAYPRRLGVRIAIARRRAERGRR